MAPTPRSRAHGALLSLACGDALGAPLEFLTMAQARHKHGWLTEMVGGGQLNWAPGEWTDDTGMALCVARGIIAAPSDPVEAIGGRFLQWSETARDVGLTVGAALTCVRNGLRWEGAGRATPQAGIGRGAGNGSLMRTLPVSLAYADRDLMLATSARVSAMTHWDPQAEMCCAIYCLWVAALLDNESMADAWRQALTAARAATTAPGLEHHTPGVTPLPDNFWARLEAVAALPYERLQPSGYAGYVVEALEAAAWCCLNARDVEETLVLAVNLAGEADTIGAIAGGIAGACYGEESIPRRWLERLHARADIHTLADALANLRTQHLALST